MVAFFGGIYYKYIYIYKIIYNIIYIYRCCHNSRIALNMKETPAQKCIDVEVGVVTSS